MANMYEEFRLESMPGGGVEIVHTCYNNVETVDDVAGALAYIADHTCEDLPVPEEKQAGRDTFVRQIYGNWMADLTRPLLYRFPRSSDCE